MVGKKKSFKQKVVDIFNTLMATKTGLCVTKVEMILMAS